MLDRPKTLAEARSYRYHVWAGNKRGTAYAEGRCSQAVFGRGLSFAREHQCKRNNGHGTAGLYCKQHAKEDL